MSEPLLDIKFLKIKFTSFTHSPTSCVQCVQIRPDNVNASDANQRLKSNAVFSIQSQNRGAVHQT